MTRLDSMPERPITEGELDVIRRGSRVEHVEETSSPYATGVDGVDAFVLETDTGEHCVMYDGLYEYWRYDPDYPENVR